MNGKQAKRLRRAALGMAVHMVETGRTVKTATEHSKPQPAQPVDMANPLSQPSAPAKHSDTEINRPDTLRGIYRYLKKTDFKADYY
jgi:hypothetical protein